MVSSASLEIADSRSLGGGIFSRPVAVVGCSQSGTAASPVVCSTPDDVLDAFGYGPLSELMATLLARAGGPVIGVRAAGGTPSVAVVGSVAQQGAGSADPGTLAAAGGNTSTAVLSLGGTADAPYPVKIKVTKAGANLAAAPELAISLDGGVTYLPAAAAAAGPTAIGTTGLTLTIVDGTFVLSDVWEAAGASCATTGDATGTSTMTAAGTPLDAYDVRVMVTRAASSLTALTAAVKVSLDAGLTYGEEIAIPSAGTYTIPNTGVTLTFAAGSFVAGDTFRFKTAPNLWTTTTLRAALDALAGREYQFVVVVGAVDATAFTTVAKDFTTDLEAAGTYVHALCETRDQVTGETVAAWVSALTGGAPGFSGAEASWVTRVATRALVESSLRPGTFPRRSVLGLLAARLFAAPLSEHPGRVRSGPCEGLYPDQDTSSVAHDMRVYSALDVAGFSGLQTIIGRPRGEYYFTDRTAAAPSSDFTAVQRVRVIQEAARIGLQAISEYVNDSVKIKTDGSGRIQEGEAKAIDAEVLAKVRAAVAQAPNDHATAVVVRTNRTDNLASTETLRVAISLVPKGYLRAVSAVLSYSLSA